MPADDAAGKYIIGTRVGVGDVYAATMPADDAAGKAEDESTAWRTWQHSRPATERYHETVDAIAAHPGTGSAIVVVGGDPGCGLRIHVHSHGRFDIPELNLRGEAQRLDPDTATELADLLDDANTFPDRDDGTEILPFWGDDWPTATEHDNADTAPDPDEGTEFGPDDTATGAAATEPEPEHDGTQLVLDGLDVRPADGELDDAAAVLDVVDARPRRCRARQR